MDVNLKLCIDCQHHKIGHRCGHPEFAQVSLVDGSATDSSCHLQRASLTGCGPIGEGFVRKLREVAA